MTIKFKNVIGFEFSSGCNFIILYGMMFYIHNNYLVCDMDGFDTISCGDAEIMNVEDFIEGFPDWAKEKVIRKNCD